MSDKDRQIIEHIVRHCKEVIATAERFDNSEEVFKNDHVFLNACSMGIFQIGELSKRMSETFKTAHKDLPWNEMRGMRNLFAHEYDSLDKDALWGTVQKDIPALLEELQDIMQDHQEK